VCSTSPDPLSNIRSNYLYEGTSLLDRSANASVLFARLLCVWQEPVYTGEGIDHENVSFRGPDLPSVVALLRSILRTQW